MLSPDKFFSVIESAPLVSIELIVRNSSNDILLGMRENRPPQGQWFVPGGRIFKNEPIEVALERILKAELSISRQNYSKRFVGVFEHFYEDSYFDEEISTHYVVLAYEIRDIVFDETSTVQQHSEFCWMSKLIALNNPLVHCNSKAYF